MQHCKWAKIVQTSWLLCAGYGCYTNTFSYLLYLSTFCLFEPYWLQCLHIHHTTSAFKDSECVLCPELGIWFTCWNDGFQNTDDLRRQTIGSCFVYSMQSCYFLVVHSLRLPKCKMLECYLWLRYGQRETYFSSGKLVIFRTSERVFPGRNIYLGELQLALHSRPFL